MGKLRCLKAELYNRMIQKLHSKRGMTLVELLSALITLLLVSGGWLRLYP